MLACYHMINRRIYESEIALNMKTVEVRVESKSYWLVGGVDKAGGRYPGSVFLSSS